MRASLPTAWMKKVKRRLNHVPGGCVRPHAAQDGGSAADEDGVHAFAFLPHGGVSHGQSFDGTDPRMLIAALMNFAALFTR